jgi:hypothetical protein
MTQRRSWLRPKDWPSKGLRVRRVTSQMISADRQTGVEYLRAVFRDQPRVGITQFREGLSADLDGLGALVLLGYVIEAEQLRGVLKSDMAKDFIGDPSEAARQTGVERISYNSPLEVVLSLAPSILNILAVRVTLAGFYVVDLVEQAHQALNRGRRDQADTDLYVEARGLVTDHLRSMRAGEVPIPDDMLNAAVATALRLDSVNVFTERE